MPSDRIDSPDSDLDAPALALADEGPRATLNRRRFLSGVTAGGVVATALPFLASAQQTGRGPRPRPDRVANERAQEAFAARRDAAAAHLRATPAEAQPTNGDEDLYADLRAAFCKTLPQNEFGEVDPAAFDRLREALAAGTSQAMARVPLSPLADRGLTSPLAAHALEMVGPDSWALRMPPAPGFASAEQAAEMGEVYWQAITRDVPLRDYAGDPDIEAAAADLAGFGHGLGSGSITPATLFRGEAPGEATGPYLSQFLWQPTHWGLAELTQKHVVPEAGEDFGTSLPDWLAMQRGVSPGAETRFGTTPRYLATARDLAEFVHGDVVYQAYLTAALVMFEYGQDAFDPAIPYPKPNQDAFVILGAAEIVDLVAMVAHAALKAAWFQKWVAHRRLRPEVFAARAEFHASGARGYDVHPDLFESAAAERLLSDRGSLLLPLAFPEGSPTHPSYPAGHAAVAGACATVLKAFFHESFEIPAPVQASADGSRLDAWTGEALTLGGEINKLASNISLGRDAAGVHYRSDGIDGMDLGEQVALGVLADYATTRAEVFGGFSLTLFDGTHATVSGDGVTPRPRRRRGRGRRLRETA